jgi:hypothetical protein
MAGMDRAERLNPSNPPPLSTLQERKGRPVGSNAGGAGHIEVVRWIAPDSEVVTSSGKFEKPKGPVQGDLKDMIDHHIRRGPAFCEVSKGFLQKAKGIISASARQDDKTRVYLLACHQLAEIDGVLGDDDPIFGKAAGKDNVIRLAEAAHVSWMNCTMLARFSENAGEQWRQALVDKKVQAAFAQGRPPGRPTSGWVRA